MSKTEYNQYTVNQPLTEQERHDVYVAMTKYGGSFVKKLAEAYKHADSINAHKLETVFRDYFEKYLDISKYKKFK